MMIKSLMVQLILILGVTISSHAQCSFDPTIAGDTILCPNTTSVLSTQVYDSYQWYKRYLFGGSLQPIPGATQQSISINDADDALYFFSVDATLDTCSEFSPEVFIDSWVFLQPFTIISGNYTIGPNGDLILCQGDTIFLVSGLPYDTNLQWFDSGNPILNANDDTLIVTSSGSFTFSGAPQICPNYIQNQFISTDITVITCPTGIGEPENAAISSFYPNPAHNFIDYKTQSSGTLEILDISGRLILSEKIISHPTQRLIIDRLAPGTYFLADPDGQKHLFIKD